MAAPQPTSRVAVDAGLSASAAKKRRARVKRNCWLTALLVVEFDVDTGHKPLFCLPAGSLTKRELAQCAVLAMPDSNTGLMGDTVFTFRMRRDRLPLFATSLAAHEYLFGTSFFRQVHDPSQPRAFSQRAVVAVSRRPYPGLCAQVVRVAAPPFFQAAASSWDGACAVLESAWMESCRWPRPMPGASFDHPLLGRLLHFRCPFTGTTDGTAPGAADSRVLARSSRHRMQACGELQRAASGDPLRVAGEAGSAGAPGAAAPGVAVLWPSDAESEAASAASGGAAHTLPLTPLDVAHPAADQPAPDSGSVGASTGAAFSPPVLDADAVAAAPHGQSASLATAGQSTADASPATRALFLDHGAFGVASRASQAPSGGPSNGAAGSALAAEGATASPAGHAIASPPSCSGSGSGDDDDDNNDDDDDDLTGADDGAAGAAAARPGDITIGDAFAVRWQELPGVFQEIGLFSTFRALAPSLWMLWEMALLGRPILVFGPNPKLCGDAVLGVVSLIAPLPFHGDYRPYFTLFDPDFPSIQAAFEGAAAPKQGAGARHASLPPPASPLLAQAMLDEEREAAEARDKDMAAMPLMGRQPQQLLPTWRQPAVPSLMTPDEAVLGQLLRVRAEDEMGGPQLRLRGAGTGAQGGTAVVDAAAADGGQVPGVVINDALLRQHFRRLTHSFLRPFERFFRVGNGRMPAPGPAAAFGLASRLRAPLHDAAAMGRLLASVAEAIEAAETAAARDAAAASAARGGLSAFRFGAAAFLRPAGDANPGPRAPAPPAAGFAARGRGRHHHQQQQQQHQQQPTFGPYDNLAAALLPPFSKEGFLASLAKATPPKMLRRVKAWRELYARFLESPHFRPWFTARREEARSVVLGLARQLRLAVTPEQLVLPFGRRPDPDAGAGASPAASGAEQAAALRLYSNILACVQRERALMDGDEAHARAVAAHAQAVEDVLLAMGLFPELGF
ncbi:hypothetical protein FNF27_07353 [Cafeteria roenbergensis]|uniref:UDENN domain-containing protein n=1 Tax=Cafeteria roenbergensis TaxID=33653 RepID=A0A5A8DTU4_CAFRO|nr:hypothetical protein FNF27_07353 [Cafeteria roenbergensis]